jgi:hypothetical protein
MPALRTFDRARATALILEALELGLSPARMLEEFYEIPYNRARYMVRTVREAGLLGQLPHRPVQMKNRRQIGPKNLLICAHCQISWPCRRADEEETRCPPIMTMPTDPPTVADLLETDRDLDETELARLRLYGEGNWLQINRLLSQRAHAAYAAAPADVFRHCITLHMDEAARAQMIRAEAFHCPECGTLLKDRQSLAASAILTERQRLADLWTAVEESRDRPTYSERFRAFRAALGLPEKRPVNE